MSRIACLWMARLPLAALLRAEPELCGLPVVIADDHTPHSLVLAVSAEAVRAGVVPGVTLNQARAVCGTLVARAHSADAVDAAMNALADVAESMSTRVEVGRGGAVFLDCSGSGALCASEAELATVLTARAERQGLAACVGIGGSKLVARLAAREGGGVRIVEPGHERAYLAPLQIALLDPDDRLAETFASWGIRRIGDLAALPPGELAHRLGPAGARLARQARGEDDQPLRCRPAPVSFSETVQLDYGVERVDRLLFVLRRLVDRMTSRLALHGLACGEFEVRLDLEEGGLERRLLAVAAPTADAKVLLTLLRVHLEQRPPVRGVTGVTVFGTPAGIRPVQLDFFRPAGPSPTALAGALTRLAALCGSDRIGTPMCASTHRPGVVAMASFPGGTMPPRECGSCSEGRVSSAGRAVPTGNHPVSRISGVPEPLAGAAQIVARAALRAFRPPVPLDVFENTGRLDYVRGPSFGGRVVHVAGPWRLRGEWWTADPYVREYYDFELSDGGLYRIYRDARTNKWLADGIYD